MKHLISLLIGAVITLMLQDVYVLLRAKAAHLLTKISPPISFTPYPAAITTIAAPGTQLPATGDPTKETIPGEMTTKTVNNETRRNSAGDEISPEESKALLDAFNSGQEEE